MRNTTANDVIQSFESSFVDKKVLSTSLEMEWFRKAVGRFSAELDPLTFDEELHEFDCQLDRYVIDTLAEFMMQSYQESQVSLANKRVSIVGKDISIDGANGAKLQRRRILNIFVKRHLVWLIIKNRLLMCR